jgi:hypothetical protein
MNEFLETKELFPRCVCLKAERIGFGDDRKLAAYVFQLKRIGNKYEDLILKIKLLERKLKVINLIWSK